MTLDDVYIRFVILPETIKAVTIPSQDGYNIYLNSRHICESQREAFDHEIEHIQQNHFNSENHVSILEVNAENKR